MGTYKAALLDASGTLWRGAETAARVWHDALSSLGVELPFIRVEEAEQRVVRRLAPDWAALETSGVPNTLEKIEALLSKFNSAMVGDLGLAIDAGLLYKPVDAAFQSVQELYPDTVPVLDRLHGSYHLAVISNGVNQAKVCRRLGIDRFFDEIIGSLHVGLRKPMPEIFHMALGALDAEPHEAVMVGDSWDADVLGAEAVGIKALHIVRDGQPSPSADAIEDLWGLVRFLDSGRA